VVSNNEKRETHERVKKQRRTLFCLFDERSEEKTLPKKKDFSLHPEPGLRSK
jgi:CRISPR/Cas system CMR-associated protein Cmr1 (group 7 of RAMP superfamily)